MPVEAMTLGLVPQCRQFDTGAGETGFACERLAEEEFGAGPVTIGVHNLAMNERVPTGSVASRIRNFKMVRGASGHSEIGFELCKEHRRGARRTGEIAAPKYADCSVRVAGCPSHCCPKQGSGPTIERHANVSLAQLIRARGDGKIKEFVLAAGARVVEPRVDVVRLLLERKREIRFCVGEAARVLRYSELDQSACAKEIDRIAPDVVSLIETCSHGSKRIRR